MRDIPLPQCSVSSPSPVRRSQLKSGSPEASAKPVYQRLASGKRRWRKAMTRAVKAIKASSAWDQSIQVVALSWL